VAVTAIPRTHGSGFGQRLSQWSAGIASASVRTGRKVIEPHRAALRNLASIPLTVLGAGCVDVGIFTANSVAGWICTGLSLILVEHVIADEK